MARRAYELTPEILHSLGIHALLLDVDNTLTTHGCPTPDENVRRWLGTMRAAGIALMILSNNSRKRVEPFAQGLGLLFEARAAKPLALGYRRCCKRLGLPKEQVAIVGDQIFTDIAGGNLFGIKAILVEPILPEAGFLFCIKRAVERPLMRRYQKAENEKRGKKTM